MDEKAKAAADLVCKLIKEFNSKSDLDTFRLLLAVLMSVQVSVPMTVTMEETDIEKFLHAKSGDTVTTGGTIRMKPDMLQNGVGEQFFPAFTLKEETPENYRNSFSWITMDFMNCVQSAYSNKACTGVVINGFSEPFLLNKQLLKLMIEMKTPKKFLDNDYIKQNASANGKCGENMRWYLLDGNLYIEGTGALCAPDVMDWGIDQKILKEKIFYVSIGEGCSLIEIGTFWGWNRLQRMLLPSTFTRYGYFEKKENQNDCWVEGQNGIDELLYESPNLEAVEVHPDNPLFTTADGVLFDKQMHTLLRYPQGKKGEYTIPESVDIIGDGAFYGCIYLSAITFPEKAILIDDGAFEDCMSLREIELPSGMKKIPDSAFCGCKNLKTIHLPTSLTEIDRMAFADCRSLIKMDIPESVNTIGARAFSQCANIGTLHIPDSVTSIGKEAFQELPHIVYYGSAYSDDAWGAKRRN